MCEFRRSVYSKYYRPWNGSRREGFYTENSPITAENRDYLLQQHVISGVYDLIPGSGVNLNRFLLLDDDKLVIRSMLKLPIR